MTIPPTSIVSREEAARRQRDSRHHTIIQEGEYAAHYVHDPITGIVTLVREAQISPENAPISN